MSFSSNRIALEALFQPRAVAVVGVSKDPIKRGRQVLRNVMAGGFSGRVYGIGRGMAEADGAPCHPALAAIGEPIDVAFLAVPAEAVGDTLRECHNAGAKVAIVGAAGFAESGDAHGIARQAELHRVMGETGIRVVGPNCNGIYNAINGLALGFNAAHAVRLPVGSIAILSHSGALFSVMAGYLSQLGAGISVFVSAGNEADFDMLDYLEYVLEDSHSRVAALLIDSLPDGERFRRLAERACQVGKRIVALKVGVSEIGAKAALAHSSRLAGSAAAYAALFEACGVARVTTLEGLMTTAAMLSFFGRAEHGLGAFTTSGAGASLIADIAAVHDVPLPELQASTRERLGGFMHFTAIGNPTDLGMFERGRSAEVPSVVAADPGIGALVALVNPLDPNSGVPTLTEDLAQAKRSSGKPFVVIVPGGLHSGQANPYEANGMRVFPDTERTIEALGALLGRACEGTEKATDTFIPDTALAESLLSAGRPLTEPESLAVLSGFGINVVPTVLCSSVDEMVAAATRIKWPVVAKAVVAGVAHKTEAGFVRTDLRSADALRQAYAAFGSPTAVAVQPFVKSKAEVIVGLTWSRDVGMMLLAGLGGIYAEAWRDVVMWPVPASPDSLQRKLSRSTLGRMLASPRWDSPRSAVALLRTLQRLQSFAQFAAQRIKAVDINPLLLTDDGAVAVDALIVPRGE